MLESGFKSNLNKELEREYRKLDEEGRDKLIERMLLYRVKQWQGTAYPITEDQFEQKWEWYRKHGMKIQLTHCSDIKFRHEPNKWLQFYTCVRLIENIMAKYPDLKTFIYGPDFEDFRFSDVFLEDESEFQQNYMRQISRTEKNTNIGFDSFWTTAGNSSNYALSVGCHDKLPLDNVPQT